MEYYYTPPKFVDEKSGTLIIEGQEYKHLTKSLRRKVGDEIEVTDGNKNVYRCLIESVTSKELNCKIEEKLDVNTEPDLKLNLYICLLKNSSRFEFAIEKCVELGVHSVTPVISSRSITKKEPGKSKIQRMQSIIISGMCQSQRSYLPKLNKTLELIKIPEQLKPDATNIVMYELEDTQKSFSFSTDSKEVNLLIGPEGGFTNDEIQFLTKNKWQTISLGKRKFRAETAAIVSTFKILN